MTSALLPKASDAAERRPRGRPRQFDEAEALDAAVQVFWRKGYAGASLAELTQAMGLSAPSLYAAFGDKARLFERCVQRYQELFGQGPQQALRSDGDVQQALRGFFRAVVRNTTGADTPPGCFVVCCLADVAGDDPHLARLMAECFERTDALLLVRFQRAQAVGQCAADADLPTLAALANSLRQGLVLRARAGTSRAALLRLADASAALVAAQLKA